MPACRDLLAATIVFATLGGASAFAEQPATSSEGQALSGYVGSFDMTETVWSSPGAQPTITTGLVADRHMIGTTLQELLHVAGDAASTAIKRMDL